MKCYSSILLHIFQLFLWTRCITSLAGKAQGPEGDSWWRQLWCGCNCFREGDTGQKSGFGLNHYKVRGLTVPCSLAVMHFLSTQRGLGDGWKADTIWEALFSHPLSTTVILIRGKWSVTCDITQSHYNDSHTAILWTSSVVSVGRPQNVLKGLLAVRV